MKKLLLVYALLTFAFGVFVISWNYKESQFLDLARNEGLKGAIEEKYVMVTFQSGLEYWKGPLKGFEDAAEALNVSAEYHGATQYDLQEQITVLEQIIARKPAGIAISAINPQALSATIDKAVEDGIPVVLFDSGAVTSKAYSFLATDNYYAGVVAARKMAELMQNSGEAAVITQPNQMNHQERTKGFVETMAKEFPGIRIVAIADGKGDQVSSRDAALTILDEHPLVEGFFATQANGGAGIGEAVNIRNLKYKVKIVGFDTNKATLDMIKDGTIAATMAQGTWQMGYWSLQFLFHLRHELVFPAPGSSGEISPLPPFVDTGITVVTERNVDSFYAK